jgi:hypothetical protein
MSRPEGVIVRVNRKALKEALEHFCTPPTKTEDSPARWELSLANRRPNPAMRC